MSGKKRRATKSHAYSSPTPEPRHANHHGHGMRHYEEGDQVPGKDGMPVHKKKIGHGEKKKAPGGRRSLVRHLSGSFRALARIAGRRNAAAVVLTTKNKDHLYAVDSAEDDIKASGRQGKIKKKHAVAHWGETQLKPPNGYDKRENQHQDDEKFKKKSEKELALEKIANKKNKRKKELMKIPTVKSIKSSISLRFKRKREISREEQRRNNIVSLSSLIVCGGIIAGVLAMI